MRAAEEEPLQYADFAEWQHQLLSGEDEGASAGRAFWADAPPTNATSLPFLAPSSPTATEDFEIPVSSSTLDAIASAAEKYAVAPAAIVQAAWHATISRLAGEDDVTIGYVAASRIHDELATAVGPFARPLSITSHTNGTTVAELAVAIQHAAELAERWQDTAPPDAARASVGFVAVERPKAVDAGGVRFACERITAAAYFPVELEWDGTGCRLRVEPAALRPRRRRADRALRRECNRGGRRGTRHGRRRARAARRERRRPAHGRGQPNDDRAPLRDRRRARRRRRRQRRRTTRRWSTSRGRCSYRELEQHANRLAHRLRKSGVTPGSVVGLCTDRSTEMIVALLGILKAGAAYLPLNFEHPSARLAHQLAETGATAIVTQETLLQYLPDFEGDVVCIDRDRAELDREPRRRPTASLRRTISPMSSTRRGRPGRPRAWASPTRTCPTTCRLSAAGFGADGEPLAFGMVSAISTDLGNTAVFPALCHGGTLVLVSPARRRRRRGGVCIPAGASGRRPQDHAVAPERAPRRSRRRRDPPAAVARRRRRGAVVGRRRARPRARRLPHPQPLRPDRDDDRLVHVRTSTTARSRLRRRPCRSAHRSPTRRATSSTSRAGAFRRACRASCFIAGAGVARGYVGRPDLTDGALPPPTRSPTARRDVRDRRSRPAPARRHARVPRPTRRPGEDPRLPRRARRDRERPARASGRSARRRSSRADDGRGERRLVAYVVARVARRQPTSCARISPSGSPSTWSRPRSSSLDSLAADAERQDRPARAAATRRARTASARPTTSRRARRSRRRWPRSGPTCSGVDRVGVEDDFFALGGHSLLATQIVAQVRSDFSINLPLHALFTSPTVAALSQQIVELLGQAPDADDGEAPRRARGALRRGGGAAARGRSRRRRRRLRELHPGAAGHRRAAGRAEPGAARTARATRCSNGAPTRRRGRASRGERSRRRRRSRTRRSCSGC